MRIGLISDTHGLLRPEAVAFLRGADRIVHAGDICDPSIVEALERIAPTAAVRGNNDHGPWARAVPETLRLVFEGIALHVLHDLARLDIEPASAGVRVVVSGHSHQPLVREQGGVLYVNPGSAGPRRFRLPITAGELQIEGARVAARTVVLVPG